MNASEYDPDDLSTEGLAVFIVATHQVCGLPSLLSEAVRCRAESHQPAVKPSELGSLTWPTMSESVRRVCVARCPAL